MLIEWEMSVKELWKTHTVRLLTLSLFTDLLTSIMFLWQPETLSYALGYVALRSILSSATIILRNIKQ